MDILLDSSIRLPDLSENITETLKKDLTLENPKWIENNNRGRWNGDTPRHLKYYTESEGELVLPRGYMRPLINTCRHFDIAFEIKDLRRSFAPVSFQFSGKLKPFQEAAARDLLQKDFGVLTAATGAGKTVIGLYLIAQRAQPALVIVHTRELLNQWISRIETFLKIPKSEIGIMGAGKRVRGERITVGMVQTLYRHADMISPHVGYILVDECHRTPSRTFNECINQFGSRYMTGLSATPWRRDKLSKLIFWHLGEMVHKVDNALLIEQGDIVRAEIIARETAFESDTDASQYYSRVLSELVEDKKRNALICSDIAEELDRGEGICLVLSDRRAHCEMLAACLKYNHRIDASVLTGDLTSLQRKKLLDKLLDGKVKVLIATGQLIGEGFDCRDLTTLFLATPVKFSGRLLQYLGRVLRPSPGKKKARIFDYVDVKVGVLEAAARSRTHVYNRNIA